MTSWSEFSAAQRDFARRVMERFTAHRHHTMATLRSDGSPRVSGTEVVFADDGLALGVRAGARRAADLRRDGRVALHSCTADADGDPAAWGGDAKLSGTAVEVAEHDGPPGSHRFVVDLTEVVLTRVGVPADHLVIETWHPGCGLERIARR